MEKLNIETNLSPSFKKAEYTFDLPQLLAEFKDQFGDAELLELHFDELPYTLIGKIQEPNILFSEDGKKIEIKYRYYFDLDPKSKQKPDSPEEFFRKLRFLIDKAVKMYKERFLQ